MKLKEGARAHGGCEASEKKIYLLIGRACLGICVIQIFIVYEKFSFNCF
jgi:hypothetical protein